VNFIIIIWNLKLIIFVDSWHFFNFFYFLSIFTIIIIDFRTLDWATINLLNFTKENNSFFDYSQYFNVDLVA
jgi:hypothetical protein